MQLSFVETMRGWIKDESGEEHPVSFHVYARGCGRGRFLLRGLASAPPWIGEGAVHGTLTIEPWLRALRYRLDVLAPSGERYALEGEKFPSAFQPLRSLTVMTALLRDGSGRPLATGEMRFDLGDVVAFATSWLPLARTEQRKLDAERRALERRMLDGFELGTRRAA